MIYEVTLTQHYFDQLVVNRWNYLSTGTPVGVTGAFALMTAMGFILSPTDFPLGAIADTIQNMQSADVVWGGVLAKAIREAPTDFYDYGYPGGVVGAVTSGQGMSPINAWGFRTNRTRTDINRGTKRIVGITEGMADSGGVLVPVANEITAELAEKMSETLSYTDGGNSLTFAPIVVQKERYTVVPSGNFAYRYYSTIALQLEHIAQGVVWQGYDTVRSQTSRQYGHGA